MATKYDIIKSASGRSGIAEGMWEVLSKYAEPDYQRQIKADEENQRAQFLIDEIKAREAEIKEEKRLEELAKTNFDTPHLKWSSPLGIILLITSVTIIIVFAATNQFNI